MKVLYISAADYKYGAPKALKELVLTLKEQYDVEPIVLTKKRNPMNEWCDNHQIENYYYWYRDIMTGSAYSHGYLNILKHLVKYLLFAVGGVYQRGVLDIIPNIENVDLIHTNLNRLDIGGYIAKKTGIPQVCHLRELKTGHSKMVVYKKHCIQYLNNTNVRFFAISNLVKENWKRAGLDEKKISVVYDGIDIHLYKNDVIKEFEKLSIVCVGRIENSKGQLQIVEALGRLPQEVIENTKLYFVGEAYEEYKKKIEAKILECGLQNRVKFLGYCDDISQILQKCNVGITSSKGEAFGRVTVEYMVAGLITVATDAGANSELITNGKDGLLYPYGDSKELAEKLTYIYNNKNIAYDIAQRGKEKSLIFSKERNAKKIYEYYCELLG